MRLESLLAATGGRLLNTPAITRFDSVALRLSDVQRGSLYLPSTPHEIPQAIEKGAYGIATDFMPQLCDEEVAWILWPSRPKALMKLLPLWLAEHSRRIVLVTPYTLGFIAQLAIRERHFVLLDGSAQHMSEILLQSRSKQTLFCADSGFLERIGAKTVDPKPYTIEATLLKCRAFSTDWVIEGRYYDALPVVSCLRHFFIEALGLLYAEGYTNDHIHLPSYTPDFFPYFCDRYGEEREPSIADRAIVFARHASCDCIDYLQRLRWAPRTLFLPKNLKGECAIRMATIFYDPNDSLASWAQSIFKRLEQPGFVMVIGIEKDQVIGHRPHGLADLTKGLF